MTPPPSPRSPPDAIIDPTPPRPGPTGTEPRAIPMTPSPEVTPSGFSLSDLSIRNPVLAVMLGAAMIIFGYLGYREMGVSQFPEIDFPVVSIVITREAASPDIM